MSFGPVRRALLALAIGGFGIGTGEFVILGLLPNVAGDLGVSIPSAGHLVSAYALGVVAGAPLLTIATVRLSRKTVLVGLMTAFALGNFASAAAPNFDTLLVARFLTGLPHGAFFGAGSVVAAGLVGPARRTAAMSVMFMGLTVANVVGVPLTTLLGQHTSWRLVFALVAVIGLVAALAVLLVVPAVHAEPASLRHELSVFAKPQVWLALGIATIGGGALFATFSYITPMMTHVAGYAESSVTLLLVLFGLGMTAGNAIGARLADKALMPTLYGALAAEVVIAGAFLVTSYSEVAAAVTIFLFPATSLALLPPLQMRIISLAGGAPNLAAASIQAAFNIANSLGAFLGGLTIAAGFGYDSPNAVAAGLAVLGLGIALTSGRLDRRRAQLPVPSAEAVPAEVG
ncbi:MAG TPA: MFS transporter [Jatrophihabitantaceae bacterium]|jgi:DHA1 family inner membrane transport protein|nr:MFS transporter [Jatrophihabitantaceae bacterium]